MTHRRKAYINHMKPSKKIDALERKKWDLLKKRTAVFDSLFSVIDRKKISEEIEMELDAIEREIISLKRPELDALLEDCKNFISESDECLKNVRRNQ